MSKPKVCRDIVKVIYPLYTKKGNVFSGLYTRTNYDIYKYNKISYVRGEPMFFAEDLHNKSSKYKHISEMPITIEDSVNFASWKYKYKSTPFNESSNTIENYVTHLWLSK